MRKYPLLGPAIGAATLLLLGSATPALAQWNSEGAVTISPSIGGLWFSQLAETDGRLPPLGGAGERTVNAELTAQPSVAYGLSLGVAVGRWLDVRLAGSFASTELDWSGVVGAPGAFESFETVGGVGDVFVSTVDLGLLWRLAERGRAISPYAILGGGIMIWDFNDLSEFGLVEPLVGARLEDSPRTSVRGAAVVGLGADLRLRRSVGLRLEARDHVAFGPFSDSDLENPIEFAGVNDASEIVHAFQLSAGLAFHFGGADNYRRGRVVRRR